MPLVVLMYCSLGDGVCAFQVLHVHGGNYFGMAKCLGFAGAVTGYGSLSSYQRFLQYTLIHDFGFGHRIFPFPLQVMTSAICQFPNCGTRLRDQWHMLLGNLV